MTIVDPPLPAPVHIAGVHWMSCEHTTRACLTWDDARRLQQNRIETGRWMSRSKAVIVYYRRMNSSTAHK